MGDIVIREAAIEDAEGIAQVHVQSWRETYAGIIPEDFLNALSWQARAEKWQTILREAKSPSQTFVAEEGGVIKGFINIGLPRRAEFGYSGEVYALYTLKEMQGRGMGRKLVEKARECLALNGIMDAYVWVLKDNPALGFYQHIGGQEFACSTVEIGGMHYEDVALGWK